MAEVKVLKPGYARWVAPARQHADGTITLIKGKHNIIVDTGLPQDRETILGLLKDEGLATSDIHFVICTHGHSDHIGNNNLFPQATFIVSYDICLHDLYTFHNFSNPYLIDDEAQVLSTPGHSSQDISVLVHTDSGIVVVAGDLFENEEDLTTNGTWIPFSEMPEKQRENREKILEVADFIVPGHGNIFQVKRTYLEQMEGERRRRGLSQLSNEALTTPLRNALVQDLVLIVEDALRNLGNPQVLESHPIVTRFPSLTKQYSASGKAISATIGDIFDATLKQFQAAPRTARERRKRNPYSELIRLRYLEGQQPSEVWTHLGITKSPYYEMVRRALQVFSEYMRQEELKLTQNLDQFSL